MCHSFQNLKLNINISKNFYDNLIKFIFDYTKQQINNINKGINIIQKNKIDNYPTEKQIKLALDWCKKYDININKKCIYLNN